MKLQRATVIEVAGKRFVEMLFADRLEPGEDEAQIRFVVPVSAEGYPRLPESQLEALDHVQSVLETENKRLKHARDQAG